MVRFSKFLCAMALSVVSLASLAMGQDEEVYTVYFDLNQKSRPGNVFLSDGFMQSFEGPVDDQGGAEFPSIDQIFRTDGYCFDGWTLEPENSLASSYGRITSALVAASGTDDGNIQLYARWTGINCINPATVPVEIVPENEGASLHGSIRLQQYYYSQLSPKLEMDSISIAPNSTTFEIPWKLISVGTTEVNSEYASFTFHVLDLPDAGYELSDIEMVRDEASAVNGSVCNDDFSYERETRILKIKPIRGCKYKLKASYSALTYSLSFEHPIDGQGLFYVKDEYGYGWPSGAVGYSIGSGDFPIVYDMNGCRYGWVPASEELAEQYKGGVALGMTAELAAIMNAEDSYSMKLSKVGQCNMVMDKWENVFYADEGGSVEVVQTYPNGDEVDLVKLELKTNVSGVPELDLPVLWGYSIPVTVVPKPKDGYSLRQISVEKEIDGVSGTFVFNETANVNLMESASWTISFERSSPRYYAYDFELTPEEMEDLFFESAVIPQPDTVYYGQSHSRMVFHKTKAFLGWSLIRASRRSATDRIYVDLQELQDYGSMNPNAPTTLYAVWKDKDASDAKEIAVFEEGHASVWAYQFFGKDTLFHAFDENGKLFASDTMGVQVWFKVVPDEKYEFVKNSVKVYAMECETEYNSLGESGSEEDWMSYNSLEEFLESRECYRFSNEEEGNYYLGWGNLAKVVFEINKKPEEEEPVDVELVFDVLFDEKTTALDKKQIYYGYDWVDSARYTFANQNDTATYKLPAYVYTSDACVVGWSEKTELSEQDWVYTAFDLHLAERSAESGKNKLYAVWADAQECGNYNHLKVSSEHGVLVLQNVSLENDSVASEYRFAADGSTLLPKRMDGFRLVANGTPDAGYELDSLVLHGSDSITYYFAEGVALPLARMDGELKAYFGKANKTPVEIVYDTLMGSGNAVAMKFKTSDFDVARGVKAYAFLIDAMGVVDTLLTKSVEKTSDTLSFSKFPLRPGSYKFSVRLSEGGKFVDSREYPYVVEDRIVATGEDTWQMISMALVDTSKLSRDDDQIFYWWDDMGTPGLYWQYKELGRGEEFDDRRGFWYNTLTGQDLLLNSKREPLYKDVKWNLDSSYSGWNLVANPYGCYVSLYAGHENERKSVNEKSRVNFVRYDVKSGDYVAADTLMPYEAVWAEVSGPVEWRLKAEPVYISDSKVSGNSPAVLKKSLAKAENNSNWYIQAVLSDKNGREDSWNIMGVSPEPFVGSEPPAAMGDRVSLSIVEGKRALAKSFKSESQSYKWDLSLSASSDRMGELTLVGVAALNDMGYRVFVTANGETSEMKEGAALKVALKTSGSNATVHVTRADAVVASAVGGLRFVQAAGSLDVGFTVEESLAGARMVVNVLDLHGKVKASYKGRAAAGTNRVALEAPRTGLYLLHVQVAGEKASRKIMVK